jgi:thiol-disulfide isomerase/thioredoxin
LNTRFRFRTVSALLLLLAAGCGEKEDTSKLEAPAFSLASVTESRQIALADYEDKVLILDFWATWCPPCKREIPHFNELYETYGDEGLEILGVSVDQGGPDVVRQYMETSDPDLVPKYPVVMVDRQTVQAYGPMQYIPTTYVIDRKGRVQRRFDGYQEKEVFEEIVQKLL